VLLGEADSQDGALDLYDRARQAGYAAAIRSRSEGEAYRYRVFIRNLPSRAEAEALAARVGPRLGLAARVSL
jgi:cell division septation protein DedD